MSRALNITALNEAMASKGQSQASISKELEVSRTTVSNWLSGKALPRPDKLLKLALALELSFDELVEKLSGDTEPVVAFRKKGTTKTTEKHISNAKDKGRLLAQLVPFLPFAKFTQPPALKSPSLSYNYLRDAAQALRKDLRASPHDAIEFHELVRKFNELQAVLVPVLWGTKSVHENALHIYLPDTTTTWVYLNLDVNVHDFKFWMAHELAHALSPDLRGDEAEDFADALAGALLFPHEAAERVYSEIVGKPLAHRIGRMVHWAAEYTVSPITVMKQIASFATNSGLPMQSVEPKIYPATTNFNKKFELLSKLLFDEEDVTPAKYIEVCKEEFDTPFFGALQDFLATGEKSASYIHSVLDIPLVDAKALYAELT